MAQLDILKKQQEQAKRIRQGFGQDSSAPAPSRPAPQRTEDASPSLYDQFTTDVADYLRPQTGTINTQPRGVGPAPAMDNMQATPAIRPKSKLKNAAMRNPIYG